jgi:hypothetical protein
MATLFKTACSFVTWIQQPDQELLLVISMPVGSLLIFPVLACLPFSTWILQQDFIIIPDFNMPFDLGIWIMEGERLENFIILIASIIMSRTVTPIVESLYRRWRKFQIINPILKFIHNRWKKIAATTAECPTSTAIVASDSY